MSAGNVLVVQPEMNPDVDTVVATVYITLGETEDGLLMTVGRTVTSKERVVLSPPYKSVNTAPLRAQIVAAISPTIARPGGTTGAGLAEAIAIYAAGGGSKSHAVMPSVREWIGLFSGLGVFATSFLLIANRVRVAVYVPVGWRRFYLARCPHCGYPRVPTNKQCTECGTEFERWATLARKSHRQRLTALAPTRDLKEQLAQ
jgi:hypothetical protein